MNLAVAELLTASAGTTTPPPAGLAAPNFMVVGDSMAAGAGSPSIPDRWFNLLADLMESHAGNRPQVFGYGIGGSRLGTAAQLQGGAKMAVTVTGGAIPASGAVTLTPQDPEFDLAESPNGGLALPGFTLAGVTGTVRRPGGRHSDKITFTRNTTGAVVTAPGWQTLTFTPGEAQRGTPFLGFLPHNNRRDALLAYPDHRVAPAATAPYVVNTMTAMKNYNQDPLGRWAFLGMSSGPTLPERIGGNPANGYDPDYLEIFGPTGYGGATADIRAMAGDAHWIDVRAGLISLSTDPAVSAYARAGITPTAADQDCASAGKRYPGPSLRGVGDGIGHLGPPGQKWVAYRVFSHFVTYGWFS